MYLKYLLKHVQNHGIMFLTISKVITYYNKRNKVTIYKKCECRRYLSSFMYLSITKFTNNNLHTLRYVLIK